MVLVSSLAAATAADGKEDDDNTKDVGSSSRVFVFQCHAVIVWWMYWMSNALMPRLILMVWPVSQPTNHPTCVQSGNNNCGGAGVGGGVDDDDNGAGSHWHNLLNSTFFYIVRMWL